MPQSGQQRAQRSSQDVATALSTFPAIGVLVSAEAGWVEDVYTAGAVTGGIAMMDIEKESGR
jgi:hypothetical protein